MNPEITIKIPMIAEGAKVSQELSSLAISEVLVPPPPGESEGVVGEKVGEAAVPPPQEFEGIACAETGEKLAPPPEALEGMAGMEMAEADAPPPEAIKKEGGKA